MRLVALATFGGKPKKISAGKVSKEPPPARVLITPATRPIKKRMMILSIQLVLRCYLRFFL